MCLHPPGYVPGTFAKYQQKNAKIPLFMTWLLSVFSLYFSRGAYIICSIDDQSITVKGKLPGLITGNCFLNGERL